MQSEKIWVHGGNKNLKKGKAYKYTCRKRKWEHGTQEYIRMM